MICLIWGESFSRSIFPIKQHQKFNNSTKPVSKKCNKKAMAGKSWLSFK